MKKLWIRKILLASMIITNLFLYSDVAYALRIPDKIRIGLVTTNKGAQYKNATSVSFQVKGSYQIIDSGGLPGLNVISSVAEGEKWQVFTLAAGTQILKDGQPIKMTLSPVIVKETSSEDNNVVLLSEYSTGASTLKINKSYRGDIEFSNSGTSLIAVNELPLEEYLYGVVPREMSSQWPIEALKAQAIAARTYAVANYSKHTSEGFNLIDTPTDQVYGGYAAEGTGSTNAVQETSGMIALYNGKPISAVYHSTSGGATENNENVWSGTPLDYLRSKDDPYSKIDGYANWTVKTSLEEIRDKLTQSGTSLSKIVSIKLSKYDSGRVKLVMINDDNGDTIIKSGSEFGKLFNPSFYTYLSSTSFMSNFFEINSSVDGSIPQVSVLDGSGATSALDGDSLYGVSDDGTTEPLNAGNGSIYVADATKTSAIASQSMDGDGSITIIGHGWGHGVGMSQWGAYRMASSGKSYEEILKFYYDGIEIEK